MLEDGENGDGVGGGDERAKGQAFCHGHAVGSVGLGEAVEDHADEDGGDEGAHDGVEDDGGEVVEEDFPAEGVAGVEEDGGEEADEEDGGGDAAEPFCVCVCVCVWR